MPRRGSPYAPSSAAGGRWTPGSPRRSGTPRHDGAGRTAAPFLVTLIAVAGIGAADGGYFPSDWGLATLGFALVAVTVVLVTDAPTALAGSSSRSSAVLRVSSRGGPALSALWSPGAAAPVLEAERGIFYVAATAAALLLLSTREAAAALLGGVVTGAVLMSLYALGTKLFPGHVGGPYDPLRGNQLTELIGYANALGLATALAVLLALGFAAHSAHLATRALAGVALVVLLPTLYFSSSRGALVALAGGAVAQVALDPARVRLLVSGLVVSVPAALGRARGFAVACAHDGTAGATLVQLAQAEGAHLARVLVVLALAAATAPVVLRLVQLRLPQRSGAILVSAVVATAVIVAAGALIAAGGPVTVVERGVDAFTEPPPTMEGGDLQPRLLSGSGRGDYWHVAWEMARDKPLLGTGAGSFEAHWLQERPVYFSVPARDAHNLYLETLAELGLIGLALLLATLALPLTALSQARGLTLGPAAAGAFVAYLLHAAADWDWEMPVVTLSALFCAAVLLASQRPADSVRLTGSRRVVALSIACRARARCGPRRACRQPSHGGQQRRDRAWASPFLRSPTRNGRSAGPRGRTSPGSFAGRPSSSSGTTLRRGRAWHRLSSSMARIGVPGSISPLRAAAPSGHARSRRRNGSTP